MQEISSQRFVRVPTKFLEDVLRLRLNGTEWRIMFWVVRQTFGWHRPTTAFSWYRIAKQLAIDRGGTVRSGHALLRFEILRLDAGRLGVQQDSTRWQVSLVASRKGAPVKTISADVDPRRSMTEHGGSADNILRERCRETSTFRRTKESCKENSKTYRYKPSDIGARPYGRNTEWGKQHPAGEARPVPGKYDRISQD